MNVHPSAVVNPSESRAAWIHVPFKPASSATNDGSRHQDGIFASSRLAGSRVRLETSGTRRQDPRARVGVGHGPTVVMLHGFGTTGVYGVIYERTPPPPPPPPPTPLIEHHMVVAPDFRGSVLCSKT